MPFVSSLAIRWFVLAVAITAVPYFVDGVYVENIGSALWAAALLGLLNILVRPIFVLLTLPLTIISFGVFIIVINAVLFQFVGNVVNGFYVNSFGAAFFAAIVVSVVQLLLNVLLLGGRTGGPTQTTGRWYRHVSRSERQRTGGSHADGRDVIDLEEGRDGKWG